MSGQGVVVSMPGAAHRAAITETFEASWGLPAPSRVPRGRGVAVVYEGLAAAQAAAVAERLAQVGEVFSGPGSHPDDRAAGRACRDAAERIRGQLAEPGRGGQVRR